MINAMDLLITLAVKSANCSRKLLRSFTELLKKLFQVSCAPPNDETSQESVFLKTSVPSCIVLIGNQDTKIEVNNLVNIVPEWGSLFSLSFDLKMNSNESGWKEILNIKSEDTSVMKVYVNIPNKLDIHMTDGDDQYLVRNVVAPFDPGFVWNNFIIKVYEDGVSLQIFTNLLKIISA